MKGLVQRVLQERSGAGRRGPASGARLVSGVQGSPQVSDEQSRGDFTLQEIDISTSAELLSRYETEIPVLMIDGRKAAKYRITETELKRKLNVMMG